MKLSLYQLGDKKLTMTTVPSPELPVECLAGTLHTIRTGNIKRFRRLAEHLAAVDWPKISLHGHHKFTRISFKYEPSHVLLPEALYLLGSRPDIFDASLCVAFCGTKNPSVLGFQLTEFLAQLVCKNKSREGVVISGGVHGIDMAAHLGALDVKGPTLAVVSNSARSGLHPYFPVRSYIQQGIIDSGGGIVSEYVDDVPDRSERLLERGRIIGGLSDILVVVEASANSASVDTAKRAWLQGKKVLAIDWSCIPGAESPKVEGLAQLVKEGIASPFPSQNVLGIADPALKAGFLDVLEKVALAV